MHSPKCGGKPITGHSMSNIYKIPNCKTNMCPSTLVVSACAKDLSLCLGVFERDSRPGTHLFLVSWGTDSVKSWICRIMVEHFPHIMFGFVDGKRIIELVNEYKFSSISLYTMGTVWLGKILTDQTPIVQYRDCYFDLEQLEKRFVPWQHVKIVKARGFKFWLVLQLKRLNTVVTNLGYKLVVSPDGHVWPRLDLMKQAWVTETIPKADLKAGEFPENAIIFVFTAADRGWSPHWEFFHELGKRCFYKPRPQKQALDYTDYPSWVTPLSEYRFPAEFYTCPRDTLLVGCTSSVLSSFENSISIWPIQRSDCNAIELARYGRGSIYPSKGGRRVSNCRADIASVLELYASGAKYMAKSYNEIKIIMSKDFTRNKNE